MVWGIALGVLGAIGSVVGIVAFVDARRNRRVKRLLWEVSPSLPLATASGGSDAARDRLSILYQRPNADPEVIESAEATYVRFANLGREPIRREDIAPNNQLRVVSRGRVLDVAVVSAARAVSNLALGELVRNEDHAAVSVTFDFLDYEDGGVLRILTNGRPSEVQLIGDIVGMPAGLAERESDMASTTVEGWGLLPWAVAEILAFAGLILLFREVTGAWTGWWLVTAALFVFFAVIAAAIAVAELATPKAYRRRRMKFPRALRLPNHFGLYPPDIEIMERRRRTVERARQNDKRASDPDGRSTNGS